MTEKRILITRIEKRNGGRGEVITDEKTEIPLLEIDQEKQRIREKHSIPEQYEILFTYDELWKEE